GERGLGRDDLDAVDGEDVVQDHRRHAARQAPEEDERGDAHGDAERRQDEVAHVALEVLAEDAPERARAHHAAASSATITPSTILTTRAAAAETRSSWVTMSSVVRSFRFSSWKNSMTSRPVWVSRLPVGSSHRSTAGRLNRARAMATRCFCPPDSSGGRR